MQFVLKAFALAALLIAASGCSRLQFPWVYRIYIQQGNYIEEEMVEQLEVGMTPEQVRFVMGNPMILDTFHPDRWDYYFTLKRGENQMKEYHFQVFFEDGKLARWDGTYDKTASKNKAAAEALEAVKAKEAAEAAKGEAGETESTTESNTTEDSASDKETPDEETTDDGSSQVSAAEETEDT